MLCVSELVLLYLFGLSLIVLVRVDIIVVPVWRQCNIHVLSVVCLSNSHHFLNRLWQGCECLGYLRFEWCHRVHNSALYLCFTSLGAPDGNSYCTFFSLINRVTNMPCFKRRSSISTEKESFSFPSDSPAPKFQVCPFSAVVDVDVHLM